MTACQSLPEIPQITIRSIDVEHYQCRLYELENPELLTFRFKSQVSLEDCDGAYGIDAKDLMALRGWLYLVREGQK